MIMGNCQNCGKSIKLLNKEKSCPNCRKEYYDLNKINCDCYVYVSGINKGEYPEMKERASYVDFCNLPRPLFLKSKESENGKTS